MEMAEQVNSDEFRQWDELIPDALGLIFGNLALQEILTVVPRVCKSWARAVAGPYCWQEIDIDEWSARSDPDRIDRMLRLLLSRSSGSLRKLSVSNLSSDLIFSFLAQHAGSLQTLRVPRSEMSDAIMEQVAGSFSGIRFLDLSYCLKMGPRALEAVGRNCKLLIGLCRNMHPLDTAGKPTEDDEAHAIAATMPGLRHLEMAYHLASTASVLRILSSCPELEFLDVRGCWSVDLDPKLVEERVPKIRVLGPVVVDHYGRNDWDDEDCSDFSDASSEYLAWEFMGGEIGGFYDDDDVDGEIFDGMWDNEAGLDGLELRFYEGVDRDADGWPPSP